VGPLLLFFLTRRTVVIQIAMLVMGVIALIKGEIKLTRNKVVHRHAARLIGLVMIAPLPTQLFVGIVWGVILGLQGLDPESIQERILSSAILVDLGITLGCALLAITLGLFLAKPPVEVVDEDLPPQIPLGPPRPLSDNPYEPPSM
jgi:hypothetical protein